ncbi:MAG TPA: hypothetical protein VIC61_05595 [Gammaproteobacteria bacterium]|jgi:hypothetical protein
MSRSGKLWLVTVMVAAAVALYLLAVPRRAPDPESSIHGRAPAVPDAAALPDPGVEDETRRLAMQVAYGDLEKDRLLLNRQLGALNAKLWGRRLPAARAQSVQSDMMAAKSLLTNPPLLGAFSGAEGIQHERERVQASLARLEAIESQLAAE